MRDHKNSLFVKTGILSGKRSDCFYLTDVKFSLVFLVYWVCTSSDCYSCNCKCNCSQCCFEGIGFKLIHACEKAIVGLAYCNIDYLQCWYLILVHPPNTPISGSTLWINSAGALLQYILLLIKSALKKKKNTTFLPSSWAFSCHSRCWFFDFAVILLYTCRWCYLRGYG